jgi:hypothetical protein
MGGAYSSHGDERYLYNFLSENLKEVTTWETLAEMGRQELEGILCENVN